MSTIVTEGSVLTVTESFVDDFDDPLELANTEEGPYVVVIDKNKDTVLQAFAVPDANGQPGDWSVNLNIPKMGLEQRERFVAVFTFKTAEGDTVKIRHPFEVDPFQESRDSDIVVIINRDQVMTFGLPIKYSKPKAAIAGNAATQQPGVPAVPGDKLSFHLYSGNTALFGPNGISADDVNSGVSVVVHSDKSMISIPAVVGAVNVLEPLTLLVEHKTPSQVTHKTFTFKVWAVTPSVLSAASQLEDFINKARATNVIPELAYTQADLIQYLHRGLGMFNGFGPQLTSFTGMNMKGMILDGWLQCSQYYALASQLQAEGQMAFDFSGQAVSLNVDRTPSIESALGRVESMLQSQIKPMKQLLAKNGVTGGDGSAGGGMISGPNHLGTLHVINAPTTKHYGHRPAYRPRTF